MHLHLDTHKVLMFEVLHLLILATFECAFVLILSHDSLSNYLYTYYIPMVGICQVVMFSDELVLYFIL